MTSTTGSHNEPERARAHGAALTAALTAAARGDDLEPALTHADAILAHGFYTGTQGELLASMLYRLQLVDFDTGTSTADYFALSKHLVEKGVCTAADMKGAVCGGILMRGQERGWLEPQFYDMLAHAARGRPDWQLAISTIARGDPGPFPAFQLVTLSKKRHAAGGFNGVRS